MPLVHWVSRFARIGLDRQGARFDDPTQPPRSQAGTIVGTAAGMPTVAGNRTGVGRHSQAAQRGIVTRAPALHLRMQVGKIEPKVAHPGRKPQSLLYARDGAHGITIRIPTALQPAPRRSTLLWPSRGGRREVVAQESLGGAPPAKKDVFSPQQELIAQIVRCLRDSSFQQSQVA